MICPILFIRKPDESECLRDRCAFWVGREVFDDIADDRRKFSALLTVAHDEAGKSQEKSVAGKCAVLTLAEVMIKNKE